MVERLTTSPSQRPGGRPDAPADGWTPRSLWFTGPLADEEERRPPLTRQRVVTEALTAIAEVDCDVDPSLPWTERSSCLRIGCGPGTVASTRKASWESGEVEAAPT